MTGMVSAEARIALEAHLSAGQEQLWFLTQLAADLPVYNEQVVMRRRGPLDPAALERGLREVVRRHPALRTTFVSRAGRPVQVVAPPGEIALDIADLSHL